MKSNWTGCFLKTDNMSTRFCKAATPCNLLLTTSSTDRDAKFPVTLTVQLYVPACVTLSMTSTRSTLPCCRTVPVEQLDPGHVHEKLILSEDSTPTTRHTRTTLVPCSTLRLGKSSMTTVGRLERGSVCTLIRYDSEFSQKGTSKL